MTGLTICLVSLIVVSVFSYIIAYQITSDLSDKRTYEAVLRNSSEIDYWFNNRQNIIESLSQDIEATGDFSSLHLKKFIKGKMEIYKKEFVDFYFGFEDSNREFISGVDWIASEGYNPKERPWYQLAMHSNGVVFTEPYRDVMSGELVITVAKALKNKGEIIGVIATDIYLTKVIGAVADVKINENSYAILLDKNGSIIAHPNPQFLPGLKSPKTLVDSLFTKGENIRIELRDYTGKDSFFSFKKMKSNGWYFGIIIDKSEYEKPLNNLLLGFAGAFIISMLTGLIIMVNLVNKMIKPIKSLNNTVKAFSFDKTLRTPILALDEIGELGKSFNDMADSIQEYSESLEKKLKKELMNFKKKIILLWKV